MLNLILIITCLLTAVYTAVFFWFRIKKQNARETLNQLDLYREAGKAPYYVSELLETEYAFIRRQMEQAPIDAIMVAHTESPLPGSSAQLPQYLVLSGEELHLLDMDAAGYVNRHLVFDRDRLQHSRIEEVNEMSVLVAYNPYDIRTYKLQLETDSKPLNIIVNSTFIGHVQTGLSNFFVNTNIRQRVKELIVGNYFLEKLGRISPSLKVHTF